MKGGCWQETMGRGGGCLERSPKRLNEASANITVGLIPISHAAAFINCCPFGSSGT